MQKTTNHPPWQSRGHQRASEGSEAGGALITSTFENNFSTERMERAQNESPTAVKSLELAEVRPDGGEALLD